MRPPSALLLAATALALASPARAQFQTMPMPPSASDPAPKEQPAPAAKGHKATKPARHKGHAAKKADRSDEFATPSAAGATRERPGAPPMQLEDDPQVAPQLTPNGQVGMGMKF